jgi:hypothetical protein
MSYQIAPHRVAREWAHACWDNAGLSFQAVIDASGEGDLNVAL